MFLFRCFLLGALGIGMVWLFACFLPQLFAGVLLDPNGIFG